jgi:hypothetical protein
MSPLLATVKKTLCTDDRVARLELTGPPDASQHCHSYSELPYGRDSWRGLHVLFACVTTHVCAFSQRADSDEEIELDDEDDEAGDVDDDEDGQV